MKFSIIVPCYKVEEWVKGCLDSILESCSRMAHPEKVEIICVDDGSPDRSGAILDEYGEKVRVIHQANAGVSAARNRGLDEAKGEWVLFVDGDDQLMPETLPYLERVVAGLDADILHFDCAEVARQDEEVPFVEKPIAEFDLTTEAGARNGYLAMRTLLAWNGCYRRKTIDDVRFKKMHPGEDSLFANEVFVRARRVAKTDTRIYRYLQREGSVMHTPRLSAVMSSIESTALRFRVMKDWSMYASIAKLEIGTYRNTLGGMVYGWVMALSGEDRRVAWARYVEAGREIFRGVPIYGMVYLLGWRWLVCVVLYWQYLARAWYVQNLRMYC